MNRRDFLSIAGIGALISVPTAEACKGMLFFWGVGLIIVPLAILLLMCLENEAFGSAVLLFCTIFWSAIYGVCKLTRSST